MVVNYKIRHKNQPAMRPARYRGPAWPPHLSVIICGGRKTQSRHARLRARVAMEEGLLSNSPNKLCLWNLNFDSSKAKQSKWLLECCRCTHVIHYLKYKQAIASGVLQRIENLYISERLYPPHFLLQVLGLSLLCWHNIANNWSKIWRE